MFSLFRRLLEIGLRIIIVGACCVAIWNSWKIARADYLFKQDTQNNTVDNLVIFITAKTISAEGAPVEQIFNSDEVRKFHLKRSDMPGYRDGSDPYIDESPNPKKRSGQ